MSEKSQTVESKIFFWGEGGYSWLLDQAIGWADRGSNSSRNKDFSILQNALRTLWPIRLRTQWVPVFFVR